jgi:hypothetical protein
MMSGMSQALIPANGGFLAFSKDRKRLYFEELVRNTAKHFDDPVFNQVCILPRDYF